MDNYWWALLVSLVVLGVVAYLLRWLSISGSVAAIVMGICTFHWGGLMAITALLFFFVSSTLLGKLPRENRSDQKDGRPRDALQVLCNGGVATLVLVINALIPFEGFLWIYIGSLAISTADTWSSEVGQWAGGVVLDAWRWNKVPQGISGGVSLAGTIAGIAGSSFMSIIALALGASLMAAVLIILTGTTGMWLDSLLGSCMQAKYLNVSTGELSDYVPEGEAGSLVKGKSWMTNDLVNLVSNWVVTFLLWAAI